MTQVVEGVSAIPARAPRDRMSTGQYGRAVAIALAAALVFRIAFAGRGTFTGDDWIFRELTSGRFSPDMILYGHNGHLNPVGLTLQWVLQQVFPGRYVPLMVLSAVLVVAGAALAALWFAVVFGRRPAGVAVALITALSPMLMELMTWWSVALYAAPMVLTSWLTILLTTRYALGRVRLRWVLVALVLCLLSSSKALLMPLVMLGVMAGLALHREAPLGFRRAVRTHLRLWSGVAAVTAAYLLLFVLRRGEVVTSAAGPAGVVDFMVQIWRVAFSPAVWAGPWTWFPFGFHNSPAPVPVALALTTLATLGLLVALLILRPRVWRMMLTCLSAMVVSLGLVAIGRAGGIWSGPNLRYTFDLLLPWVLIVTTGLFTTRWETGGRSPAGERLARWRGWPAVGLAAMVLWIGSLAVSMATPWRTLPLNPLAPWVDAARANYPYVSNGLLPQAAPREISVFAEPLDRFLAGDPGKPPLVTWVPDRAMGLDGEGRLIDKVVDGVTAVEPSAECMYRANGDVVAEVPLTGSAPEGSLVVALDYQLNIDAAVAMRLGDSEPIVMDLPPGARRVYATVTGPGEALTLRTTQPGANLCVMGAVVGTLVDGPLVDPRSLPKPASR